MDELLTFLRTTLSISDILSSAVEMAFYLTIIAIYIDRKHIAIHCGNDAISKATSRISKSLIVVAGFIGTLCSLSFAAGYAYSISYLRLLSGFFFAMLVSCMVLVLSVKGLEAYGFLAAISAPLISLAIVPPTSRFLLSLTFNVFIFTSVLVIPVLIIIFTQVFHAAGRKFARVGMVASTACLLFFSFWAHPVLRRVHPICSSSAR